MDPVRRSCHNPDCPAARPLPGRVIEHHPGRRVVGITRRMVRGTAAAITAVLLATGTGTGIDTASPEPLDATSRGALNTLTSRGRAIAHAEGTLNAGMYLVGRAYNFCRDHDSIRRAGDDGEGPRWRTRTLAMAAGLTDHRWTIRKLLDHPIPLTPWVAPKRRGRPPKREPSVVGGGHDRDSPGCCHLQDREHNLAKKIPACPGAAFAFPKNQLVASKAGGATGRCRVGTRVGG
jgi:hypothetical protein